MKKLEELFGTCEVIQKDSGYWVMKAIRAGDGKDE
jgi:16S rRNA G1207 methylase RsmC